MKKARLIIHVDMDAFFASVEQLDRPETRGKAVIVGGNIEGRGVVCAASYEARKFGVHSAMPISQAARACPNAIILPVRKERYSEISKQIHKIFHNYTPQVEPLSVDEAFLDVTGTVHLFGDAESLGRKIKSDIKRQTGLTASVGIAPNKFLAKMASDLQKPDGLVIITEENKQKILDPLPVSKIWGIGKVASKSLYDIGITTVRSLRETPLKTLELLFKNQAQEILMLAQGIDDRDVITTRETKSISLEQTFNQNLRDRNVLASILRKQVEEVSGKLRAEKLQAKTVTVKVRYSDFKTITRSSSFPPTNTTQTLLDSAMQLFDNWYEGSIRPIRLLGFGASGLSPEGSGQKWLFSDPQDEKQKDIDKVFDQIRNKFGKDALKRGD